MPELQAPTQLTAHAHSVLKPSAEVTKMPTEDKLPPPHLNRLLLNTAALLHRPFKLLPLRVATAVALLLLHAKLLVSEKSKLRFEMM
jgi:hypothetical protein